MSEVKGKAGVDLGGLTFTFPTILFILFAFPLGLRLFDLDERSAAGTLVVRPPWVSLGGRSVHGTLDKPEEWFTLLAGTRAAPPVRAVACHLPMETVEHLQGSTIT